MYVVAEDEADLQSFTRPMNRLATVELADIAVGGLRRVRIETSFSGTVSSSDASFIPMIDLVFPMLIFFMAAGTLEAGRPGLDARSPDPVGERGEPTSVATASGGDDSDGGRQDGLRERVAGGVVDERVDPLRSASELAARADAGSTFRRLREAIELLREAVVDEVEFLTARIPARSGD